MYRQVSDEFTGVHPSVGHGKWVGLVESGSIDRGKRVTNHLLCLAETLDELSPRHARARKVGVAIAHGRSPSKHGPDEVPQVSRRVQRQRAGAVGKAGRQGPYQVFAWIGIQLALDRPELANDDGGDGGSVHGGIVRQWPEAPRRRPSVVTFASPSAKGNRAGCNRSEEH